MRSCFAKFEAKIQWCLRDVGQMDKARTHGFGRNSMGQSLTVGVGWQHEAMAEEIERKMKSGMKKEQAIFDTIRHYIKACKPIRFDGNGYSDEWKEEAKMEWHSIC